MSDADSSKLARRTVVAAVGTVVGLALIGVAIWMERPNTVPIEVSQQTTYIITPTRADGWVDYPEAVDWMRRAGWTRAARTRRSRCCARSGATCCRRASIAARC